ncbi:MAG: site-2 protease family protein [Methylophilus sp.]
MELTIVQKIAVYALPVLFAITVHEAAHGYVAKHFGDLTAEKQGRITLNPLKHIDPIGTILLPILTMMLGGILFGWAKPVPVNFANLRNPKKDMLWVAAAGPISNFFMAIFWVMMFNFSNYAPNTAVNFLAIMSMAGISINIVLMVLNLLPMPPLDGGRIAVSLLPMPWAIKLARVERYGFPILIVLMFTGVLGYVIYPIIQMIEQLLYRLVM